FLLDMLDNLPRLRLSDEHLKMFIWVLKELEVAGVPSFFALRKKQAEIKANMKVKSTHHVSAMKNEFYVNSVAQSIRLDLENPLVRQHMKLYPDQNMKVREVMDARKLFPKVEELWQTDLDLLPQMWADLKHSPYRHYYIREPAQLNDGSYVAPLRWYTQENKTYLHAQMHPTYRPRDTASCSRVRHFLRGCPVDVRLTVTLENLKESTQWQLAFPHPVREIAKGRMAVTVNLMIWSDDVSGNVSKQYNAHTNTYVANLNLPHEKLNQEYFVHFHSTSQFASSSEQIAALTEGIGRNRWHEAYDSKLRQEIVYRVVPRTKTGDNPQQSEDCSHIGLNGNYPCRRCKVGGTHTEKESNEGYEQFFAPSVSRTATETVREINSQLLHACLGVQETVDAMQSEKGIKDKIAQYWIEILLTKAREQQHARLINPQTKDQCLKGTLRNQLRPGDHYNPLLGLDSLDPHEATPMEILHTYQLGIDKYTWYPTHTQLKDKDAELFCTRLRST
ncbi:hypothetical protein K474DRAFT_1566504, partial [Panus rudis PR-1116 ss-1]